MATDPRRFDQIEKVVRDNRRNIDDVQSTLAARLAAHKHVEGDVASLVTDLAAKTDKSTLTTKGDLYAATAASTPARLAVGSNNQLLIADSAQTAGMKWGTTIASLAVTGTITKDSAWQSLPLTGGWTGDATRVPLMRLMPDGTVQMKGLITKSTNPVNGESWITGLTSAYQPLHTWSFLTPTPGRAYNGSQVIEVRSNGTGVIFDMAAASGIICLDNVRYAVI